MESLLERLTRLGEVMTPEEQRHVVADALLEHRFPPEVAYWFAETEVARQQQLDQLSGRLARTEQAFEELRRHVLRVVGGVTPPEALTPEGPTGPQEGDPAGPTSPEEGDSSR